MGVEPRNDVAARRINSKQVGFAFPVYRFRNSGQESVYAFSSECRDGDDFRVMLRSAPKGCSIDLSCATPPGSFSSCGIPSVSDFQAACRSFGFPVPGFDLREDDSCFTIAACVPETSPENVDVSVSDGCVTISCCAQSNETRKEKGATQNVFSARSFYKTIALPDVANTSKAEADFKNGILTITVPKRKDTAKKIPISRKSA